MSLRVSERMDSGASTQAPHFCVRLPVCPPLCDAPDKRRGGSLNPPDEQRRRVGREGSAQPF